LIHPIFLIPAKRIAFWGVIVAVLFAGGGLRAAETLDTVIIDAGYDKQTRVAVVPFRIDPRVRAQAPMESIIEFDLQRSGQFDVLEASGMLSLPTTPQEVQFRDWKILGQEFLVVGNIAPGTTGGQVLRYSRRVLYPPDVRVGSPPGPGKYLF